jgi:hypothetical protein
MFTYFPFFIILPAIGAFLDAMTVKRQKNTIHDKLTHLWITIADTEYKDITSKVSKHICTTNLRNKRKHRVFLFLEIILLSWLTTTTASILGIKLGSYVKADNVIGYLPFYPIYIANFIFDAATLMTTLFILNKIIYVKAVYKVVYILLDICLAYLFAVL